MMVNKLKINIIESSRLTGFLIFFILVPPLVKFSSGFRSMPRYHLNLVFFAFQITGQDDRNDFRFGSLIIIRIQNRTSC